MCQNRVSTVFIGFYCTAYISRHESSSHVNTKLFTFCDIACMVYILNTNCSEKNQRQREARIFKLHPKKETYDETLTEQTGLSGKC